MSSPYTPMGYRYPSGGCPGGKPVNDSIQTDCASALLARNINKHSPNDRRQMAGLVCGLPETGAPLSMMLPPISLAAKYLSDGTSWHDLFWPGTKTLGNSILVSETMRFLVMPRIAAQLI